MIKKLFILVFSLAIYIVNGYAQNIPVKLPAVVPPPSEAASLGRYGDVPVTMYNGTVDISVPVYEIKTRRFNLPISISYNSAGVKVDDIASWVGLGWSLNAGGIITRSVRGDDDFISGNNRGHYYHAVPDANNLSNNDWDYLNQVATGVIDEEPDYFFFNFLNHSGKFFFDDNKNPVIINYQDPLKIQYSPSSNSFTLIDGQGNQFIFSDKENTESYYSTLGFSYNADQKYVSSWYLSQMISYDKSDVITFTYDTDYEQVETSFNYTEGVGDTYVCSNGTPVLMRNVHDGANTFSSQSFIRSNPVRLQQISFSNGKITFSGARNRSDATVEKLDAITISKIDAATHGYTILKTINFNYNYFTTIYNNQTTYRLRLDGIAALGLNNENGGTYSFQYDQTMLPPVNSTAKDLFGYYNGHKENTTLIPRQSIFSYNGILYNVGGADRSTDVNYIKAGILNRITYPTGGYTNFTFEPNSYSEQGLKTVQQSATATGGMQENVVSTFVAPLSTQGIITVNISKYNYPGVQARPAVSFTNITTGQEIYSNSLTDPNNDFNYTAAIDLTQGQTYQMVAKAYTNGYVHSGITVSWQQVDPNTTSKYGGGLRINKVTNYTNDGTFSNGQVYKYGEAECGYGYLPSDNYLFNTLNAEKLFYLGCNKPDGTVLCNATTWTRMVFNSSSIFDIFSLCGAPVAYSEVSRYSVDAQGNPLTKTIFDYSVYKNTNTPAAQSYFEALSITNSGWMGGSLLSQTDFARKNGSYIPVKKIVNTYNNTPPQSSQGLKVRDQAAISGCYATGPMGIQFYYFNYPIFSGTVLLKSSTTYEYDMNDNSKFLVQTKDFTYDNLEHLQPTKVVTGTSTGEVLTSLNQYPADANAISGITPAQITNLNSLYSQHNITALIQKKVSRNTNTVSIERNDYKTGYGTMILPDVMQIQNANNPMEKRVLFDSYDTYGNITQVRKSGDILHSYLWGYNHSYPVAEVVGADYATISSYVTQSILDNATGQYTDQQIRAELDKIRTGLKNSGSKALVTTYTYAPLVGVTSKSDPNNRTLYYEYDGLGRLQLIKDQNGKAVKVYDYKYGQ